jgi:Motility quorum-sensing regulator, toxin of MqsA
VPGWLTKALKRIKERATAREVMFTLKARRELAILEFGLDEDDACDILARLTAEDAAGRLKSESTGEWMYLFKPRLSRRVLYIKLIIRHNCIVISFHEDMGDNHEDDQ